LIGVQPQGGTLPVIKEAVSPLTGNETASGFPGGLEHRAVLV